MRKEVKIGLAGVAALALLFVGINFLKGVSLFSKSNAYYIRFANAKGLSKSSTVYADGYNVGIVSDIIYDYDRPGQVLVKVSADKGLRIPKGSTAELDEAMLGGCTLNMLLAANPREAYRPGDTIPGRDASGLMDAAADMLPQVSAVLEKVDTLVATLNKLAADPALPRIMSNAEKMSESLDHSAKELDRLLGKDAPRLTATYNRLGESATALTEELAAVNLAATMDSVNSTIGSVSRMVERLQSPQGTLGLLMSDPGLYRDLNHTVQSADSLMTDLKARPKRYVHFSLFGRKN